MNSKVIKNLVFVLSLIFILSLLSGVFLNQKDDKLLDIQVDIGQNFLLSKDNTLELSKAYHSSYVNYDNLHNSNKKLLHDINSLVTKYPQQIQIQKLQAILLKQDINIDYIKRANSIITNSLYFIRTLPPEVFKNGLYKKEIGAKKLRQLSRKIIDLSYDMKLSDSSILIKYQNLIDKISSIIISHKDLINYQKVLVVHTTEILKSTQEMQNNISQFNILEKESNIIYLDIRVNILNEHLNIKDKIKFIQMLLVTLLFVFVYLIIRFLKFEKIHKEEQESLQDLISKHIIISTTDLEGIITSASDAYCLISGYSKEELVGKSHNIIRHPDMPKSAFKAMWGTIQEGKKWSGKVKNLKKNGDYYWVYAVIEPIFNNKGNIESYIAIRHDITNTIELEELTKNQEIIIESQIAIANMQRDKALDALKAKGEFLANMSHEIRTPLNAILGFVEILKEESYGRKSEQYVDIIDSSSKSLLQVIEDILDFSKIKSGKLDIDKVNFNPKSEFEVVTYLFNARCAQKNISLTLNIDDNLPETINTDPLRIKQIITNLMSNAVKFTKEKKNITVDINYDNKLLNISIKDQGIGIAHNKLNHIFDAFIQEDTSTTREYGGTGLGLSISNELVKLLGGKLKVKSEVGVGSNFYFSIPITVAKKKIEKQTISQNIDFKNKKILLVEDNKANQMFMKVILKKINLSFDIANDGVEAIEMFVKNNSNNEDKLSKYNAILMDENMPNMNGIEATKQILKYEKEHNLTHTPIIALTANALKGDREKFLNAGMDEYMTKPINKNKLAKILNMFIKKDI